MAIRECPLSNISTGVAPAVTTFPDRRARNRPGAATGRPRPGAAASPGTAGAQLVGLSVVALDDLEQRVGRQR